MRPYCTKIIRDPVHGNIRVPLWICTDIIDTEVFQRLRFIEQSSVGLLFPGARHNRFVHSLGVFHVAWKMFVALECQLRDSKLKKRDIDRLKNTFLLAAILHDCAHSPFSHTGEALAEDYCNSDVEKLLLDVVKKRSFFDDFHDKDGQEKFHAHEMASAYVGCKVYGRIFTKKGVDKEQFARMIIGLKNKGPKLTPLLCAYNCFISLINGFIIDADRLDYLLRDTWASGFCNSSVDIDRLIDGLKLDLRKGRVNIYYKCLPSIVNAISARDYIYTWILPHHKVAYVNMLLRFAMKSLVVEMARKERSMRKRGGKKDKNGCSDAEIGSLIFSPKRLIPGGGIEICGEKIRMPTDGDVVYLMKKYIPDNKYVEAYMSRKKVFSSLWKTYAEFSQLFKPPAYQSAVLSEKSFWELFDAQIKQFSKQDGDLLCTETCAIKQTHDQIFALDIVGDAASRSMEESIDPSLMFKRDGARKYYMYSYIRSNVAKAKRSAVIINLKKVFKECVDTYCHR